MLNKVSAFINRFGLIKPGDSVVCALSGGADSVALLWALYLLRDKLQITLSAAHFNHGLRGEESNRDQRFVEQLCRDYRIPLSVGSARVTAGEKGLEAAARDARYRFFDSLSGKIATAHTADDNAETVVMHLIRGTGLLGLGGISPVRGNVIRPMLSVTREDVLAFLQEYHLSWVEDSTNAHDDFLRNRIRHNVMPLLRQENPRLAENVSDMALRLRRDEEVLQGQVSDCLPNVSVLRQMDEPIRRRQLCAFLEQCGVKEPEAEHIALAEQLVFSQKPSARGSFPGNVMICRNYDRLEKLETTTPIGQIPFDCPGEVTVNEFVKISCRPAKEKLLQWDRFTVYPCGDMVVRARRPGDKMRLSGGTKSLKEIFVDRKIPASQRDQIPVIADAEGVLGVYGIGANLDRTSGDTQPVEIIMTPQTAIL